MARPHPRIEEVVARKLPGLHLDAAVFEEALEDVLAPPVDIVPLSEAAQRALSTQPRTASGSESLLRGATQFAILIADSVDTTEAAEILGVSTSRVRQRIRSGTLWAFTNGSRPWRVPRMQFADGGGMAQGLDRALSTLGANSMHPVAVAGFLRSPQADLGGASVLEWLSAGNDIADVLRLVELQHWAGS